MTTETATDPRLTAALDELTLLEAHVTQIATTIRDFRCDLASGLPTLTNRADRELGRRLSREVGPPETVGWRWDQITIEAATLREALRALGTKGQTEGMA